MSKTKGKIVRERGWHKLTNYVTKGYGLTIESMTAGMNGFFLGWELACEEERCVGRDVESFISKLKELIKKYDLKQYNENKRDTLIIFTDNLLKAKGFFYRYITECFPEEKEHDDIFDSNDEPIYIRLLDFIELRSMEQWNEDLKDAADIANHAQYLIDNLFIPNKYFYITPNQIARKKITHAGEVSTCKEITPTGYREYLYLRKALFGGLMYSMYDDRASKDRKYIDIDEPMLALDLVSAYIYALCVEKHCMSKGEKVDTGNWEFYLDSQSKLSLGSYKITYSSTRSCIKCFKTMDGERAGMGTHEDIFIFTNIDLKNFMELADCHDIQCLTLREYDADYLPKKLIDVILEFYIKKQNLKPLKDTLKKEYDLIKVELNGVYGDTIRVLEDADAFKSYYKTAVLAPQWGIWTTSYCKRAIVKLGKQLDGWLQSNTDSIKCLDTPRNRKLIDETNEEIRSKLKVFAEKFGYDYNIIKDLGTFDIEAELTRLKMWHANMYVYKTKDGKIEAKTSGCAKKTLPTDDSIFDLEEIPGGEKVCGFMTTRPGKFDYKDLHFANDGSYYELRAKDKEGEDLLKILNLVSINKKLG